LAGLQNSAAGIDGWKPMADEAVISSVPDVIIAMDHGPQTLTAESILTAPAFAGTPAAKTKSVLIFNGEYLLSFGPRTPQAAHDLLVAAYPEVAKSGEVPRSQ
jgi:iron complex transport system substrate-binding protein